MNPLLRARTDSNIMPRTKHPSQKWRTKDGPCEDWNIKNVAFSVKTACTLFIVCVCVGGSRPVWPPMGLQGCRIVLFHCRCQQCVRSGSAADWQTVPLQPAANQPVSNTCCYQEHNVQPAVPLLTPRGFVDLSFCPFCLDFFLSLLPSLTAHLQLNGVFSLGNMPSKEGRFTYLKTSGARKKTLLHSG